MAGSSRESPNVKSTPIEDTSEPGEQRESMDVEPDETDMMKLMGFGGFDSTKVSRPLTILVRLVFMFLLG